MDFNRRDERSRWQYSGTDGIIQEPSSGSRADVRAVGNLNGFRDPNVILFVLLLCDIIPTDLSCGLSSLYARDMFLLVENDIIYEMTRFGCWVMFAVCCLCLCCMQNYVQFVSLCCLRTL